MNTSRTQRSEKSGDITRGARSTTRLPCARLTSSSPVLYTTGRKVVSGTGDNTWTDVLSPVLLCLSLSRLNHWLPGCETQPEVMQGTTEFHHDIADAVLPQPNAVFHDAAALDAAVDMLDPQPTVMQGLVGQLLLHRQLLATGFLRRHL